MELMDTSLIPNKDGEIHISDGDYGWKWDKLTNAIEKASYCYTDTRNELLLEKVIKDQTGAKKVIFHNNGGYIDHQSSGLISGYNEEELKNIIFNPKSTIYIGNDNDSAPLHFYFNSSNGKYKLTVIEESKFREMNIYSILESYDINDDEFKWVYMPNKNDGSITEALYEFMDGYDDIIENHNFWSNSGKNTRHDFDIENERIIAIIEDSVTREELYTKVYKILIKENDLIKI